MFKAEYFFPRILLPFLAGILFAYFLGSKNLLLVSGNLTITVFGLLFLGNLFYKRYNLYRFKGLIGIGIFFFFLCLGSLLCLLNKNELKPNYFGKQKYTYLKVWVSDEPQQKGDILRFIAQTTDGYSGLKKNEAEGKLLILLNLKGSKPVQLNYGDELIISADYKTVEPPKNPAEFDFKGWLASQNVYQQAFIKPSNLAKTGVNKGNSIIKFAFNLRKQAVQKYRKLLKNDAAFSIASTLVLGYKADLDADTRINFANTGTMHALSVSGAHVGIIYLVLEFCLQFLNKKKKVVWLKPLIICFLIWNYALITGLSPSVVRASTMLSIFIFAKGFTKSKNGYNILAFAAFLQLLFNPFLILNVGFQLSYVAVFGLLYLQPKIYKLIYVRNKSLNYFWKFAALSLAAQLVTFPLAIYYFHKFPLYFLLGNLFISLPLIAMMYLGIIVLIPGFSLLAPVFEYLIVFTNQVLHAIASLPFSTLDAIWITFIQFLCMSLALGLGIYACTKRKKKFLFASLSIFLIYQILILKNDLLKKEQHKILFFSLRKNYAAAFIKGQNAVLVSDLKSDDKTFLFSIKPALDQAQVRNLKFASIERDTSLKDFTLKNQQIIFNNFNIFLLDSRLNYKKLGSSSTFDAVWVHDNPKYNLDSLTQQISFKNLIIDAGNKPYKIKEYETFANNFNKNATDLKRQGALIIDLNREDE